MSVCLIMAVCDVGDTERFGVAVQLAAVREVLATCRGVYARGDVFSFLSQVDRGHDAEGEELGPSC